jgi:HAD superfamily hydrolase (TIGR01549 family)
MKFHVTGHENLKATHKSTLEFTKEDFLTKRGDCILGINANVDFETDLPKLKKALDLRVRKLRKIEIKLKHGSHKDSVFAYYHSGFKHKEAMVIRKSDFLDSRTFAYKANKSAKELKRELFEDLQKKGEKGKLHVDVSPVKIKNIIFDFDDTIEEWTESQKHMEDDLAEAVHKRYKIPKTKFFKKFKEIMHHYILHTRNPKKYGRGLWIRESLRDFDIEPTRKEVNELVEIYWKKCNYFIRLEKHVIPTLKKLKEKYNLFILSDSDGGKQYKTMRVHKLGLEPYFKDILTSDDTKANKPSPDGFNFLLKKHKLKAQECIAVGDHAQTDLYTPKKLGMSTVWIKQGHWGQDKSVDYNYIDFEINDIKSVLTIVKKFE